METLKVSSKSNPNSVAGALAIKSIIICRGFVAPSGKNLKCIPAFTDITIDGDERTAIKLIVEAE